jgi:hypothetical protein
MNSHYIKGAALAAVTTLAACGGSSDNGVQPASKLPVANVVITPTQWTGGVGDSIRLAAVVSDSAGGVGVSQSVRWSIEPSAGALAISDSGEVTSHCNGGTSTVTARSTVDTTVLGTAVVSAALPFTLTQITSIVQTGSGQPANLSAVTDSITVSGTGGPIHTPCSTLTAYNLVVHSTAGDTVVATAPIDTTSTALGVTFSMVFHTDAKVSGAPRFPDGAYSLFVRAVRTGTVMPERTNSAVFTITN